ncbi:hypothetical protein KIW84_056080 [Lathyrus oleraceus]|uniref:Uncharacterized protein n=1 Tax=Pisum sativum TaxID=3888 RepID=A0A9D4X249_PEA|nr:hypothetical protein KIW84_056080 [Pisum sativum]
MTGHINDYGVWVAKWMIECLFRSDYEVIIVVTPTRMKLTLYLLQSSNNVLLKEILSKASSYWDVLEKKRKALVKI